MKVNGRAHRSIWLSADRSTVDVIDQTQLPHAFVTRSLRTRDDAASAIKEMIVRGAPLIGATAAYGMALAMREDTSDAAIDRAYDALIATRPTAVNLRWALDEMRVALATIPRAGRAEAAFARAGAICDQDVAINRAIGEHGLRILRETWEKKNRNNRLNIMTHCNAGWLATVDWGTALAPIYLAHDAGLPMHVWVSETRPRNQGASLTAWELQQHGVSHTVIVDNAAGYYLRKSAVDMILVGADRVTANGDVANKIGTYLKAIAAHDNGVPFYVAVPSPSIDWTIADGADIVIEERSSLEVTQLHGRSRDSQLIAVQVTPAGSPAANPGFDVTPARLVTAIITEQGVCAANKSGLRSLFPQASERTKAA